VSNALAATATSGPVTVTENLPVGLKLVSMQGSGWNCVSNMCTSNTVLNPGSYSTPILVTVEVASGLSGQVMNVVTASGGGSATSTGSIPTTIASACDIDGNGIVNAADVQLLVNAALGETSVASGLAQNGVVNVVGVEIVIGAAMGWGCNIGAGVSPAAVFHGRR